MNFAELSGEWDWYSTWHQVQCGSRDAVQGQITVQGQVTDPIWTLLRLSVRSPVELDVGVWADIWSSVERAVCNAIDSGEVICEFR